MLFELKYTREGKAYDYWKIGIAAGMGFNAKTYPKEPKVMSPELFEKQKSVAIPDWLKDDYEQRINKSVIRR